jgi:penicillin-binding protein 1A
MVGRLLIGLMVLVSALVGASVGLLLVYSTDLPQVDQLERYRPSSITELYDDQGRTIGSFALQRRVVATYNDYPQILRQALISIEDKDFYRHWGINVWRIAGAAYRDMESGGKVQGASTLTMQLARNLFLSPDRSFHRKVQEALLAVQIERHFTKPQIFRRPPSFTSASLRRNSRSMRLRCSPVCLNHRPTIHRSPIPTAPSSAVIL